MKTFLVLSICIGAVMTANAQAQSAPTAPKSSDTERLLEAKIRKAWDDVKDKRKEAFAAIFADDAVEVEEGADGPHDKKTTLAEMDEVNMTSVSLKDFHYRPIGSSGLLVRYAVEYSATFRGEPIHNTSLIGEVWEKAGDDWKLVYFQETKLK